MVVVYILGVFAMIMGLAFALWRKAENDINRRLRDL